MCDIGVFGMQGWCLVQKRQQMTCTRLLMSASLAKSDHPNLFQARNSHQKELLSLLARVGDKFFLGKSGGAQAVESFHLNGD